MKDIDGTEVTIPKDITKVADLWHANNQVVLMLGGADTLVSTTKNVQGLPWFAKVYPRIKEIPAPVKGTDVQMEEIQKVNHKTIIDEWIRYAGGKNAITADGPQITVTIEEIVKANPDIIIIGGTQSRKGIEQLMNDPQWASLKAVQNGRVYSNPVGTFNWDRYSAESALQILWAGQMIQPELFSDVNLVKETQEFYKTFLHYDLSIDDAQRIIAGEGPQ